MLDRIEKIEEELNLIKYNFEFNNKYIESEIEKTKALNAFTTKVYKDINEIYKAIDDLKESYVEISKLCKSQQILIDSLIRTQKTILEIINTNK